jgi:hypothetical protein
VIDMAERVRLLAGEGRRGAYKLSRRSEHSLNDSCAHFKSVVVSKAVFGSIRQSSHTAKERRVGLSFAKIRSRHLKRWSGTSV